MRKIARAAAGAALGLVLTSSGFVAATAAHAGTDLPTIPGASAERPIPDSFTGFNEVQGAQSTSKRDDLRVFAADRPDPSVVVTSSVTHGRLKVVDQRGRLLCTGKSAPDNGHLYSCDLAAAPSGPQVITATVVKPNGHYSEPDQALLDAYAASPVVSSTERDGDDLVVHGTANRRIRVEASTDRKEIVASSDAGADGRFAVRVPGGAAADRLALRAVNDGIPPSTPYHDAFAVSGWTDVSPAPGGGEQPGDGSDAGTEQPGDGNDGGEQPGDDQPPVAAVTNLHDGDTVDTAEPTLDGTARPKGHVRVSIDGLTGPLIVDTTADEHGKWSAKASYFRPGDNSVVVAAERADGTWQRTQDLLVHYVPTVDKFTVQTPANGSTVTEARPKITGAGAHAYSWVSLLNADGDWLAMGRTDASGTFTLDLDLDKDLKPGINELTASFDDLNRHHKTEPYTLTYDDGKGEQPGDGQSPVAAVTNLHDGDTVDTAEPTLDGTARPKGHVRVSIDGLTGPLIVDTTADEHGKWSAKASYFRPGDNSVVVAAERADGTWQRTQDLLVHYVPTVDKFTVQTPANGSTVTEARPKITGAGAHAYSWVSLLNADGDWLAMGRTDASGTFTLDLDKDLKPGINELTASFDDLNRHHKTEPYTLTYDDGKGEQPGDGNEGGTEQPGDGNGGEQPGDGNGGEQPGDGASDTAFTADAQRVNDRQVDVGVHGPKGTEVTVSANGESKKVTLGDTDYGNTLITAPKKLTTTVTVTATIAGEQVERTLTIGNGDHAADALEAEVTSTSALLGSAKITVWGLPSGIGGLQAREGDRTLATGVIKDDGEGTVSVSGLAKGDHLITLVSGGKQTQVSVHI